MRINVLCSLAALCSYLELAALTSFHDFIKSRKFFFHYLLCCKVCGLHTPPPTPSHFSWHEINEVCTLVGITPIQSTYCNIMFHWETLKNRGTIAYKFCWDCYGIACTVNGVLTRASLYILIRISSQHDRRSRRNFTDHRQTCEWKWNALFWEAA